MLLMFQITTDFSEYWVYTRHQKQQPAPAKISADETDIMELLISN
jgi:hypothetical protein